MLKCTGPWFADYGRVFAAKDGSEWVCVGFSRGMGPTYNTLLNRTTRDRIEVEFIHLSRKDEADFVATEAVLLRHEYL